LRLYGILPEIMESGPERLDSNSDFTSELALKPLVNNLPLCISLSLSIKWEWQSCLHHMIIVKINRVNTCKQLQQCLVSVLSKC
jgi:hypothetical protein